MNTLSLSLRVMLLLLSFAVAGVCAGESDSPDEVRLRKAVTKSLGFLTREADRWMNDKNCNACHHMPLLVWGYQEAQRRGFPIDGKVVEESVSWSKEHAKDTRSGPEVAAFLKLAIPEQAGAELAASLAGLQLADGSWKPGQQFVSMQRRDAGEATANSLRIILLALAARPADASVAEAAKSKAVALLEKDDIAIAKSVETLVFRALYARRFGPPEAVEMVRAEILRQQHADGGWAWVIGEEKSDPLATGEVLYFLRQSSESATLPAASRAEQWLLRQQRDDGSWPLDFTRISKLDRSKPEKADSFKAVTEIYTFWGSAWATIGLLQGVPISDQ